MSLQRALSSAVRVAGSRHMATQAAITEVFPDLPTLTPSSGSPAVVTSSALSNGMKVVTSSASGPSASVCLVAKGGSRFETTPGAAVALEHSVFSATEERSALRLARDIEDAGWSAGSAASRESLVMSVKVFPGEEAAAIATLGECATSTLYRNWEVAETASGRLGHALSQSASSAEVQLSEALHAAAFLDSKPLGSPYMNGVAGSVSGDSLKEFAASVFSAENCVLAGAGVDHDAFVAAAESAFGSVGSAGALSAASPYRGGELRVKTVGGDSYVALAFEGAASGTDGEAAGLVLQQVLTGDGLYGFSVGYSDTGLVGIYGSCAAGSESEVVSSMVSALKGAAGGLSASAFASAKATASLAAVADDSASLAENLGSSLLLSGTASASPSFDNVTAASVSAVASAALASKPTLASLGPLLNMPGIEDLSF